MKRFLPIAGVLVVAACSMVQKPEPVFSTPPASTAEACAAIRYWFEKNHMTSVSPREVTTECHMRISGEAWRSGFLMEHLEKTGWTRDPDYGKGAVPSEFAWETPTTRCTIDEIRMFGGGRSQPGMGVSGGSGMPSTYGVGLSIGGDNNAVDYKIDCKDKSKS